MRLQELNADLTSRSYNKKITLGSKHLCLFVMTPNPILIPPLLDESVSVGVFMHLFLGIYLVVPLSAFSFTIIILAITLQSEWYALYVSIF